MSAETLEITERLLNHLKMFLTSKTDNEFQQGLRQCNDIASILILCKKYKTITPVESEIGNWIRLQYMKGYEQALKDRGDL